MPSTNTLRDRLRDDTRDVHEALDATLSRLDLTHPGDFGAFLAIQRTGLGPLRDVRGAVSHAMIGDLLARLDRDLDRLGLPAPVTQAIPYDPVAVDYIALGSRLGTKVLRKRWAMSVDPVVAASDAYFSAPPAPLDWKTFASDLAARPANDNSADRIVADTRAIFMAFSTAAVEIRPELAVS